MRILAFLILICTLIMCKSKDVLPSSEQLNYIVILEGQSTAKALKNGISFDMLDYDKTKDTINQWAIVFRGNLKNSSKLMAELLNHPKVVSVFTKEQFEKLKSKNEQKSKEGMNGRNKVSKQ